MISNNVLDNFFFLPGLKTGMLFNSLKGNCHEQFNLKKTA